MHRFYVPGFSESDAVLLPEDEARHLTRVLRLASGDTIAVFDGHGREAIARVESVASGKVTVRVLEHRPAAPEPAVAVTLAQSLLKSDKMDHAIRDCITLGVSEIQPLVSRRTDVPQAALKDGVRLARWQRSVVASVKQCGRAVVPRVLEAQNLDRLLASTAGRSRLMLVEPGCTDPANVASLTSLEGQRPSDVVVLIGPEGGWDPVEVDNARAAGVTLITLGGRVLRAESAGVVAISVLRYIWRDL